MLYTRTVEQVAISQESKTYNNILKVLL